MSILLFPQRQFLPFCLSSFIPPQQCLLSVFFCSSSWIHSPPSQTRTAGLSCWGVSCYALFAKMFCMLFPESWLDLLGLYLLIRSPAALYTEVSFQISDSTSSQGPKHRQQPWEKHNSVLTVGWMRVTSLRSKRGSRKIVKKINFKVVKMANSMFCILYYFWNDSLKLEIYLMMILYVFIVFLPLKCQIFTRHGGQGNL